MIVKPGGLEQKLCTGQFVVLDTSFGNTWLNLPAEDGRCSADPLTHVSSCWCHPRKAGGCQYLGTLRAGHRGCKRWQDNNFPSRFLENWWGLLLAVAVTEKANLGNRRELESWDRRWWCSCDRGRADVNVMLRAACPGQYWRPDGLMVGSPLCFSSTCIPGFPHVSAS